MEFGFSIRLLDRCFIAGLLEGEACFTISEQNGGQSYSCGLSVRMRDDEQDLLEWLVAFTGLGRLYRVAARSTSRPQLHWSVQSTEHCLELDRLIEPCGFRGRRLAELEVWRAALDAWTTMSGTARRRVLRELKARLEMARRYGHGASTAAPLASSTARRGHITGFVSAEGSFQLTASRARFAVQLRQDDRPLLEMLAKETGLGAVYDYRAAPPMNPSSAWVITARSQLVTLGEILFAGRLRGRKRDQLEAWSDGVAALCDDSKRVPAAIDDLGRARAYHVGARRALLRTASRDLSEESLDALWCWSRAQDGPLSCVDYMRWRRGVPSAPARNTVVRQFGSWHRALAAAGLADRVARPPRPVGGAARRERRRQEQRERVVEAVGRCARQLGRIPKAMEFFRWRREFAPDTPTQGTVYRLFDGGWSEIQEAVAGGTGVR